MYTSQKVPVVFQHYYFTFQFTRLFLDCHRDDSRFTRLGGTWGRDNDYVRVTRNYPIVIHSIKRGPGVSPPEKN